MSADEVIDTGQNPGALRRRRMWLRVGVPIGGVALIILAILTIVLYTENTNRTGVLVLSEDLLTGLQERIAQEVIAYLSPASRAARLARSMIARNAISDSHAALEAFASSALREIPQIDALYSADEDGNFMMVQRGTNGGVETKVIRNAPSPRRVEWVRHDTSGHVIDRRQESNDIYDPRTRDWYQGALKSDDVFWTGAYVFFTHRAPGITAAVRYDDTIEGRVFGVDITLETLSEFLASLKIGRSGRAVIFDDSGHLIAAPDISHLVREQGGQLVTARLDEIDDTVLAAAYDHLRVEGYGRHVIEVGNTPIVSISSRLPGASRAWSVLIVVPEKDFTGFVATNGRRTLWLSLTVILLAATLAALVVRQGLRADRAARQLLERGHAIEQQSLALAELAGQSDIFDRSQVAPMQFLTTALADLAGARRASIWRLMNDGRLLHCEDAYECDHGEHVVGLRLTRSELPHFFAAVESGEELQMSDAAADRRTAELQRALMHPFGSRSVCIVPLRTADRVLGVITLEDAASFSRAHAFVALAASMLAIRLSGATDVPMTGYTEAIATAPKSVGEQRFATDLVEAPDIAALPGGRFQSVAVMEIRFNDDTMMGARDVAGIATLGDRIAMIIQEVAAAHDIPYVKLVGYQAIAAAGFTAEDTNAVLRVADASVSLRERYLELFEANEHSPSFHVGVDYGVAIGNKVGYHPRLFNLWGPAVCTADLMATTGSGPGMIQVSEAAYHRLREHFVLRLRGSFYLPGVGLAQTFILGSRQ
jgi:adenylate cyclase